MPENIGTILAAAGALGTAAFGIAEGLKRWGRVGEAGFPTILRILGPIAETLPVAYGRDTAALLRAQYRGEQHELARIIRQGTRIGLCPANVRPIAEALGTINAAALEEAADALSIGRELPPALRNVLGRYELAVDARIDAALARAQYEYASTMRLMASIIALGIALAVGWRLDPVGLTRLPEAALVGFIAVPLAPVAKDVVSAVKSAADALRRRA